MDALRIVLLAAVVLVAAIALLFAAASLPGYRRYRRLRRM